MIAVSPLLSAFRLIVCRARTPGVPLEPAACVVTFEEDK